MNLKKLLVEGTPNVKNIFLIQSENNEVVVWVFKNNKEVEEFKKKNNIADKDDYALIEGGILRKGYKSN